MFKKIGLAEKCLIVLSLLLGLTHFLSFGFCLQDDTYIGLRYSRNFANGSGLVYNQGERVEGYTNFSWIMLSSIPFVLNINPIIFIRFLSAISALYAIYMVGVLARILANGRPWSAFIASFLFASIPFTMAEAAMGLETLFYTAIVLSALVRYLKENEDVSKKGYYSGLILALCSLTRPETIAIVLFLVFIDIFQLRKSNCSRSKKQQILSRWLAYSVPVLSHLTFRSLYYGDIVPNTFYAKVGGGTNAFLRGLGYIKSYFMDVLPLYIALFLLTIFAKFKRVIKFEFVILLFVLFVIFNLVYIMYVGGDFKPSNRFFVLLSAIVVAIFAGIVSALFKRFNRKLEIFFMFAVVLLISAGNYIQGGKVRNFAQRRAEVLPYHIIVGNWLKSSFDTDTWLATGNAGVLPYVSEFPTIDMHGLCDKTIAKRSISGMGLATPGHEKGDGLYVLSRHPDIILFMLSRFSEFPLTSSEIQENLFGVSEFELWINPYFHENYTLVSQQIDDFYFNYYLLNTLVVK